MGAFFIFELTRPALQPGSPNPSIYMTKKSSGILLYRKNPNLEVFLVHPGGPFWKNKDAGVWSIPKGEVEEGLSLEENAIKELKEETGIEISGDLVNLEDIQQKAGKIVFCFAFEYPQPLPPITSNTFEMQWPPKSGNMQSFPEIDKGTFFTLEEAREKINPAQITFLDRLEKILKPDREVI